MFEVSAKSQDASLTKCPGYFPLEKPQYDDVDEKYYATYLVDGAGFQDTN